MIYEFYFYANFAFLVDIKIFNHGIVNESSGFFCRPNYTLLILLQSAAVNCYFYSSAFIMVNTIHICCK